MNTISCWRLEAINEDRNSLIARFSTKREAEVASPCAGGYGPEITKETIEIWDSAAEFKPVLDEAAKASGLAKLTLREKQALGIET